jgi:DNA-binding Lrp family transcriptional regulator
MPSMAMDRIDLNILEEAAAKSPMSNVDLARRVNLSPSPCLARVRALELRGVISRYVALIEELTISNQWLSSVIVSRVER